MFYPILHFLPTALFFSFFPPMDGRFGQERSPGGEGGGVIIITHQ